MRIFIQVVSQPHAPPALWKRGGAIAGAFSGHAIGGVASGCSATALCCLEAAKRIASTVCGDQRAFVMWVAEYDDDFEDSMDEAEDAAERFFEQSNALSLQEGQQVPHSANCSALTHEADGVLSSALASSAPAFSLPPRLSSSSVVKDWLDDVAELRAAVAQGSPASFKSDRCISNKSSVGMHGKRRSYLSIFTARKL